jgi:hypothetical protein
MQRRIYSHFQERFGHNLRSTEFQILSGARDLVTGLWRINLRKDNQQLQQPITNNVYELRNTGA